MANSIGTALGSTIMGSNVTPSPGYTDKISQDALTAMAILHQQQSNYQVTITALHNHNPR